MKYGEHIVEIEITKQYEMHHCELNVEKLHNIVR